MIPYIVVSPSYRNHSAGVRALFILCERLRQRGQEAYMFAEPGEAHSYQTENIFNDIPRVRKIVEDGAIVVYPEIIGFNSFASKRPVEWCLGPKRTDNIQEKWWFNANLTATNPEKLLSVDTIERDIFNMKDPIERTINTLWVGKGDGSERFPIDNLVEITSGYPKTRIELANLLKRSKFLYTYDGMTALTSEASLCGTPSIYIPNSRKTYDLSTAVSLNGIGIGVGEMQKAIDTLPLFEKDYDRTIGRDAEAIALTKFIEYTQNMKALQY